MQFTEGDDVKQGDVLFTLDRRPLEAALKQAEANLERDIAQSANAASQAKRYEDLAARGIATREQVDTSAANSTALQATVGADRAAVENAQIQLKYATITAPVTGRTGALMVHPGNLVRANDATPLVIINQVAPVNVSFGLPEGQLQELRRYMAQGAVRVEAGLPSDEETSRGQVTFIDNAVDVATGQIKVKASFPNTDRRLWPGEFVNVRLRLYVDEDALTVPARAVVSGQEGSYVFVVQRDSTAATTPVQVVRQAGDLAVVSGKLEVGQQVVTDGQLRLRQGSKVQVKGAT